MRGEERDREYEGGRESEYEGGRKEESRVQRGLKWG